MEDVKLRMFDQYNLIKQLATDDEEAASNAMKALLSRKDIREVLSAYIDKNDVDMQRHIHQLYTIIDRRCAMMNSYRDVLLDDRFSFWELALVINTIIDRQTTDVQINMLMGHLVKLYATPVKNLAQFSKLIGDFGLRVSDIQERYVTDYLISDAMLNNGGDEMAVVVVAMRLASYCGWHLTPGLYRNILCLRDQTFNVIIPSNGWGVTHPLTKDFIPYDKYSFAIHLLGMIRNAAAVEQLPLVMARVDYLLRTTIALKK